MGSLNLSFQLVQASIQLNIRKKNHLKKLIV